MKSKLLISAFVFVFSNSLYAQTLFHKYVNNPQTTWYKAYADNNETLLTGNDNTNTFHSDVKNTFLPTGW